ncbi:hypothetical protein EV201_1277 [Ancylomarina subtilis]|uniref:Uncharacterized protein n=1 Tax=Ancylomarina subtilis TaxID=1639035 RepID=A0A4Q7VK75_9BACT|nr:hypothetical protein [Ancylomarina subtilis]RZT96636.1 hypothetical protein EV201_1277 [Ancylomarina subtilis]
MKWIDKLGNLLGGDLLTKAKDIIDECFTSEEEKNNFVLELEKQKLEGKTIDLEYISLQIEDVKSAREANVKIQQSENASWLAKNTPYIIDISLNIIFCASIVFAFITEDKELILFCLGMLTARFGDVVGFHRGSSSKVKR